MKRILFFAALLLTVTGATAQVLKAFSPRYSNASVRGNIVYVSNSIISAGGVGAGVPGTGEPPPGGTSRNNLGPAINIDVDGAGTAPTTLIAYGSQWRFHDTVTTAVVGTGSLNNWNQSSYIDTWWRLGNAVIYYNDAGTTLANNPGNASFPTTYFRKTINIPSVAAYANFTINLRRDDAAIVYVNGVKVFADASLAAPITYLRHATPATNIEGANENVTIQIAASKFVSGNNTIAVEVHNQSNTITANIRDMLFDLRLLGNDINTTFNSSTSDLNLPSCSEVLWAGLYWGADQGISGTDSAWISGDAEKTIKFKIPGGSYQMVNSQQTNQFSLAWSTSGFNHTGYLCFADVTSLVNTLNPNGTYAAANVLGPIGINNGCGGWTLVIAYGNPSLQPRNLNIYDGAVIVNLGDPAVDIPITGFLTPPIGPVGCEIGAVVYDGDRTSSDSFAFKQNGAPAFYNLATVAIPLNGNNDAWNSKISYKGAVVTTRNPAFQNTLGYDAPIFDLPNTGNLQLGNNQTSASIRFASPNENYFVHVLSTSISQYNPTFTFSKSATDINGGSFQAGDSLLYTINYSNQGNDSSTNSLILDNIPAGTSFIPGSITIGGTAKTDVAGDDEAEYDLTNNRIVFRLGVGANSTTGGAIGPNQNNSVQFKVQSSASCQVISCVGPIRNSAKIIYSGRLSGNNLYDSSGVIASGCIVQGDVTNTLTGPCVTPRDTVLINQCPVTSVTIPWRSFAGYQIYSAQPFIPANLYNTNIPVTSSNVYWAYYSNGAGCSDTVRIRVAIIACPDIDDDNDGIPDYVELNVPLALQDANGNGIPNWNDATYPGYIDNNADGFNDNFDPSADSDNDGIINFYDNSFPGYLDTNGDGVNDRMDKDLDGIPNHLDLDSDNDGIPDVVESYGVDQNGDGVIDNYSTSDLDGFSQNVDASAGGVPGSGNGLGAPDFDNDGIPNYLDTDSDNDGIPDIREALGNDTNNDGFADVFTDNDADGLSDNIDSDLGNDGVAENIAIALLRTGPDANGDGRADNHPFKNMDNDRWPNCYDLDSDMDGIVDVIEAGFTDANFNGFVDGAIAADGWNIALNALPALNVRNSDAFAGPDYLDIDADDDGIPDNIEGQTTPGYQFPTYIDTDLDGLDNRYDNIVGVGGSGIFVADKDGDSIPDYLDLDTDSDGQPDIVEGNDFNLNTFADDDVALTYLDDDGDGLDNKFDSLNSVTNIKGTSYRMGTGGSLLGDPAPGTRAPVQKRTVPQPERDWRYVTYVLPLQMLQLNGTQKLNIVLLNWGIISLQPLDKFEIERSIDNSHFEKIATVDAFIALNELKNFTVNDDISSLNNPVIFYRLKVIAVNGQEKYSEVLVIKKNPSNAQVSIHPNPAQDYTTVSFYAAKDALATFVIKDFAGKLVFIHKQKLVKGNNSISLTGLSKLRGAVYHLQVIIDNEMLTQKLIINN